MNEYTAFIVAANAATLLLGGAVAGLAYRAFRRTGSRALRAVAAGFGFIVAGSGIAGLAHLIGGSIALGVAIQSSCTAGGFAVLLYSLYTETSATTTVTVGGSG
ncbi:hypothetical protein CHINAEXTREME_04490 [Halobiforma lacisalsi AJ5]|uniref:Uncharacterized protein n=1 Tax=Natronobacterium lacisalsi AJ5 TaxID=358396 RepID=M0LNV5_NATLA|nr:hypothetical protein [Halobiforma lacisalsi]APW97074.1 hypothetical protein CHINAEXTREME_04490 [Halobiforma lacisalsi AJ5]EMA34793.1 hypothetical protein C445_07745 [Halobiforma lacisalsi AJ5]